MALIGKEKGRAPMASALSMSDVRRGASTALGQLPLDPSPPDEPPLDGPALAPPDEPPPREPRPPPRDAPRPELPVEPLAPERPLPPALVRLAPPLLFEPPDEVDALLREPAEADLAVPALLLPRPLAPAEDLLAPPPDAFAPRAVPDEDDLLRVAPPEAADFFAVERVEAAFEREPPELFRAVPALARPDADPALRARPEVEPLPPSLPPDIMRRTASVAAVTMAAPILVALSAAASAVSSASRLASLTVLRTRELAVSAAAAATRPAAIMLRATGFCANSAARCPASLSASGNPAVALRFFPPPPDFCSPDFAMIQPPGL
jgi:hypothetical protein